MSTQCDSLCTHHICVSSPALSVTLQPYYSHLKRLQKGVKIDENYLGDVIFPRIHKEEHVCDSQQRQQDQGCFHSFSVRMGTKIHVSVRLDKYTHSTPLSSPPSPLWVVILNTLTDLLTQSLLPYT